MLCCHTMCVVLLCCYMLCGVINVCLVCLCYVICCVFVCCVCITVFTLIVVFRLLYYYLCLRLHYYCLHVLITLLIICCSLCCCFTVLDCFMCFWPGGRELGALIRGRRDRRENGGIRPISLLRLSLVSKIYGKSPMDMTIPPLKIKILLESNPLKSRILVPRLTSWW